MPSSRVDESANFYGNAYVGDRGLRFAHRKIGSATTREGEGPDTGVDVS